MNMKVTKLKPSQLIPNPDNPRIIKDDNFHKLVESIKEFPDMANIRPVVVNTENMILGGNMRFRAMIEAGWEEIPVIVVDLPPDKQKEFIIKDNVSGGEWDWDKLANEWDSELLEKWDVRIPFFEDVNDPNAEWVGMPEFSNEDLRPYKQLLVSFANEEDMNKFAELIGQKITQTTKFVWYPEQDRIDVANKRYVDEE